MLGQVMICLVVYPHQSSQFQPWMRGWVIYPAFAVAVLNTILSLVIRSMLYLALDLQDRPTDRSESGCGAIATTMLIVLSELHGV